MTFKLDKTRRILTELAKMCEDMWLERGAFEELLIRQGFSPDQLEELKAKVKGAPDAREQARKVFAGMWQTLEDQGREALIEDQLAGPPPSGKPN
jgi:hypothetical protein